MVQRLRARKVMEQVLSCKTMDKLLRDEDAAAVNIALKAAGICDSLLPADYDALSTEINPPLVWKEAAAAVIADNGPIGKAQELMKKGDDRGWSKVVVGHLHALIIKLRVGS